MGTVGEPEFLCSLEAMQRFWRTYLTEKQEGACPCSWYQGGSTISPRPWSLLLSFVDHLELTYPSPCEVPLLLKLLPALLNPACLLSGHGRRKSSSTGLFLVAVFCTGGDATNPYRVPHFLAEASSFSDSLDFDETPYFLRILINPTFSFSTF